MNYVEGTIFTLMVILHVQGPSFDMSLFQIYLISPQRGNTIQAFLWMSLFIKYIINQTEHKLSPIHNFILVGTHCLFVFLFSCLFACLFVCLLVFLFVLCLLVWLLVTLHYSTYTTVQFLERKPFVDPLHTSEKVYQHFIL